MPSAAMIAAIGLGIVAPADGAPIRVRDRAIRMADVVRLPAESDWRRLAAVEIWRIPAGQGGVTLTRRAIAALIRRATPGIALADAGPGTIEFRAGVSARPVIRKCYVLIAAAVAGATIDRKAVTPGPCGGGKVDTAWDRAAGTLVAGRAFAAATSIGPVRPPAAPLVMRGDVMTLVSRAGAVTIERGVTALQPGRAGEKVFVRDNSGKVFAAPIAGVPQ
ncbi:flagella basal body P-ring formation protein FlgA [uncultured Sphingomonas sp.]|uniref:flagella basal body P-ring formation protein FlgA n=1 Tax=uncultured Sphingomonas sp. TaxID=158754 RepID=UPI0035CC10B1